MAEIAPLNYERWAVIVNPMLAPDTGGVRPSYEARHVEQLIQLAPSLNNVETRKKESLIEQTLKPTEGRRRILVNKPEGPPVTSHPVGMVLRQPLPGEIFTSAGEELPSPDPQSVTVLYAPPEITLHPSVDVIG